MIRKPRLFTPIILWEVGVVLAIVVAAVLSIGAFFRSAETVVGFGSDAAFAGFYIEGQNPWVQTIVPGDDAMAVRTASRQHRARTPALR